MTKHSSLPGHNAAQPYSRASWQPYAILLVVFVVTRFLYYLAGIRFDERGVGTFFQFIDPELLKHRLWESLVYLHSQAPGYNLYLGTVLKLFPNSIGTALHGLNLFFGVIIAFSLYYVMATLRVAGWVAVTLTAIFISTPGVVLFENFPLYEYLLVFVLSVSAVLLIRFFERRRAADGLAFLFCQFCLVLLRNQFHLVYFALIFGVIAYFAVPNRKAVIVGGSILLVLTFGLFLKNYILFGQFVSSTWMGMNMTTIVQHQLTPEEMKRFLDAGLISPVSAIPGGAPLASYDGLVPKPAPTGIPVLDEVKKSSGADNYNNSIVLDVEKIYLRDGWTILRSYPKAYFRSVVRAWFAYFLPTGDFPFFDGNRERIYGLDRAVNVVLFGQLHDASNRKGLRAIDAQGNRLALLTYTGVFLLIGLPALFIFGTYLLIHGIRQKRISSAQAAVLGYMLFNILYLTMVANLLSCFENNRYRFQVDMFYVALLGLAVQKVVRRLHRESSTPAVELYPSEMNA